MGRIGIDMDVGGLWWRGDDGMGRIPEGKHGKIDHAQDEACRGCGDGIADRAGGPKGTARIIHGNKQRITRRGDGDITEAVAGEIMQGVVGVGGTVDAEAIGFQLEPPEAVFETGDEQ